MKFGAWSNIFSIERKSNLELVKHFRVGGSVLAVNGKQI